MKRTIGRCAGALALSTWIGAAITGCGSAVDQARWLVLNRYVEPVDESELTETAIEAMLVDLDKYSRLQSTFTVDVTDDVSGSDVTLLTGFAAASTNGNLIVLYTWPGSAAERAGLQTGDQILAINDTPVDESLTAQLAPTPEEAISLALAVGERKQIVHRLSIRPRGTSGSRDWIWVPTPDRDAKVSRTSARWARRVPGEPDLGYVYIADFNRGAGPDMISAIDALVEDGARGIVIDLRFNPGGIDTVVERTKNFFVAHGVLGQSEEPRTGRRTISRAKPGLARYRDLPLVILVNGRSASGAEDFAGCMQDHDRAVIVGVHTRGKGSMQTIYDLDGGRRLSLTTGYFYTPKGRPVSAIDGHPGGIEPDVVVELDPEAAERLRSALRHLEPPANRLRDAEAALKQAGHTNLLGPWPPALDPQLARGVELLRARLR